MAGEPRLLLGGAPRSIPRDFPRPAAAPTGPGGGQVQHSRNRTFAENRVSEDLVMHVSPLRGEAGVLDVADDLDLVHAIARTGRAHDVLLDHHAAHVVR